MYANDCIEIQEREKRRRLKWIKDHSVEELDAAIELARRRFGKDFWLLLHGIDAYQERRRRRVANRKLKQRRFDELEALADVWGNS
jgi:hypothetical protein